MSLPTLKIDTEHADLFGAKVELDGEPIPGLRELELSMDIDSVNEVTLTIGVEGVEVTAQALSALKAHVLESHDE